MCVVYFYTDTKNSTKQMEPKNIFILYCEHSLLSGVMGDLTDIICTAVNSVVNVQALGAQKMRSLWAIGIRSNEARETLSQSGIMVNDMRIPLYINNPYTAQIVEGERVIIKDLPLYLLWVTLGCLAASSSQLGHHGVSAISNNLHDPGCY